MVATRDIGALVAETLLASPPTSGVVDVLGPECTEREVADELAALLSRPLDVVTVPRVAWVDALVAAGVPTHFAPELAALYAAGEDGLLQPRGDRRHRGRTPLRDTLERVLGAAAVPVPMSR